MLPKSPRRPAKAALSKHSRALAEATRRHRSKPGGIARINDFMAGWRGSRAGRDRDSFGQGRRSRRRGR